MTKVSIILTCFNLENYIGQAIESLLNQNYVGNYEIIIVDDGSTDKSKDIIQSIQDERVFKILLEKNVGAAQAINIAYAHCKGEYVCRFDGDDKWYPDYLQKTSNILDQYSDIALVHTDVTFIDQNGKITSLKNNIQRPLSLKSMDHEFEHILEKYYINAPAIMARKISWDKVLPWKEQFRTGLGDWYNSLLMLENSFSFFINEPLAYYRIHTTNMHRAMIKDGTGEKNTSWILDFFRKRNPALGKKKWNRIYFKQNTHLGFAYFFHGMDLDARRCLSRALKYNPYALADLSFMRIWFASFIGKKSYEKLKQFFSGSYKPDTLL